MCETGMENRENESHLCHRALPLLCKFDDFIVIEKIAKILFLREMSFFGCEMQKNIKNWLIMETNSIIIKPERVCVVDRYSETGIQACEIKIGKGKRLNTQLKNTVSAVSKEAQYDEYAKRLLGRYIRSGFV